MTAFAVGDLPAKQTGITFHSVQNRTRMPFVDHAFVPGNESEAQKIPRDEHRLVPNILSISGLCFYFDLVISK